jgi:hypothetical protein
MKNEAWLLPILLIPASAVLLNATAPRLIGVLADLHHATHGECSICAANEKWFRRRVRLLAQATFLLLLSCFAFAATGLLSGIHHFSMLVPDPAPLCLLIVGVATLLGGCGCLAAESLLLIRTTGSHAEKR